MFYKKSGFSIVVDLDWKNGKGIYLEVFHILQIIISRSSIQANSFDDLLP